MTVTDLLSVSQVAKHCRMTPQAIRKAIKEQRLIATRIGAFWVIDKNDVKLWREWEAVR